jgi:hypothetical protein
MPSKYLLTTESTHLYSVAQTGTGIPAARLMIHAMAVSSKTPSISISISSGVCRIPRLTMSTEAPAGGCEDFKRSKTAPVNAIESAAAPMRARVTPSCSMLGWSSKPKIASDKAPARTATRCPIRVLRGLAPGPSGYSKNKNAVGPRIGKSRGSLKRYAASPLTARASRQPTKLYSASPPGAEALDEPLAKTAVALLAHPRMPL